MKRLLNKPFSYYNELAYVFRYDRATGRWFADVGSNEPIGYERFNMPFGNDDFPSMYSQSLTCSRIMYAHHDLLVRQTVGRIQQIEEKEGKPARG